MATLHSVRIREPAEANGTIGVKAAARKYAKYGISKANISRWATNGEIAIAKPAAFPGDTVLLDEASLRKRISTYAPHRDNAGRKSRSRTIPQMQAEANGGPSGANGHSAVGAGIAPPSVSRPAAPARPRGGDVVLLNTQEWVDKFYEYQTIGREGGELNQKTKENYDTTFKRFISRFPTIPMGATAREPVMTFIHGLTNQHTGGPLSDNSKGLNLQVVVTFYHWLKREHLYEIPDLTFSKLSVDRPQAIPLYPDEIREVLPQLRNHSEKTIIMILAQANCRLGELCTIRPELVHDHWADVWGKVTAVNKTGHRQLAIPDEAYDDLLWDLKTYGELVWVDGYGQVKPLAGCLEPRRPDRRIDTRNSETLKATTRVRPVGGAVDAVQHMIRNRLQDAGVYEKGKGAHSFRRIFQSEFIKAGGSKEYYRLIMGHFDKSNMDDLYTYDRIGEIVEQARKYRSRRFLQEGVFLERPDLLDDDEDDE